MDRIDISGTGDHEYEVTVHQGDTTTRHRVRVPDDLRPPGVDEERLVTESFVFLLEREPATSIMSRFDLDVISRYFPEYRSVMRARLS